MPLLLSFVVQLDLREGAGVPTSSVSPSSHAALQGGEVGMTIAGRTGAVSSGSGPARQSHPNPFSQSHIQQARYISAADAIQKQQQTRPTMLREVRAQTVDML
jgi:hypothetical protein